MKKYGTHGADSTLGRGLAREEKKVNDRKSERFLDVLTYEGEGSPLPVANGVQAVSVARDVL